MGCDIHVKAQRLVNGEWQTLPLEVFNWRHYGHFGFLADVRNYSYIKPIASPRGLPAGSPEEDDTTWFGDHSFSWLSVKELSDFDYDAETEDRRVGRRITTNLWSGSGTCEPGEGKKMTYREFLGEAFFEEIQKLKDAGADRIVFGFDN